MTAQEAVVVTSTTPMKQALSLLSIKSKSLEEDNSSDHQDATENTEDIDDDDLSLTEKNEDDSLSIANNSSISTDEEECTATSAAPNTKAVVATTTTEVKARQEQRQLRHSGSSSFVRVHDLDVPPELTLAGSDVSSSSLHDCMKPFMKNQHKSNDPTAYMFFLDQDMPLILNKLTQLGWDMVTDESPRFTPGRETAAVLKARAKHPLPLEAGEEWPAKPWHASNPAKLHDILIWSGAVTGHEGFGHDWPIIKARGIIPTSPRTMMEFFWESANVAKYNSMSQGREDVLVLQDNVDTTAEKSVHGFAGCAKVLMAVNKIKFVPKLIETYSLLHARALEPPLAPKGTYMLVNRSLWEGDDDDNKSKNQSKKSNNKVIRSEMLLGVTLLRPIKGGSWCEITTCTHMYSPGINKMVARAAAPVSAAKILRDIQALHADKK